MTPKGLLGTPQREQPRWAPLARRLRSVPAETTLSRRTAGFAANQHPIRRWPLGLRFEDIRLRVSADCHRGVCSSLTCASTCQV